MTTGFLSRWSRRKLETTTQQSVDDIAPEVVVPDELSLPDPLDDVLQESGEDEAAIVADLPDIESLNQHSDFSAFMQNGVPEELQKLALRKLWRTNPVFANLDGLNDYDEDFSVIRPLMAGVADELLKIMKENRTSPEANLDEQLDEAAAEENLEEVANNSDEIECEEEEEILG